MNTLLMFFMGGGSGGAGQGGGSLLATYGIFIPIVVVALIFFRYYIRHRIKPMNNLLIASIITLASSIIAFIWGYAYMDIHKMDGLADAFGHGDSVYIAAKYLELGGAIAFLVGIGLLIGGLVRNGDKSSSNQKMKRPEDIDIKKYCSNCGVLLQQGIVYCSSCGARVAGE